MALNRNLNNRKIQLKVHVLVETVFLNYIELQPLFFVYDPCYIGLNVLMTGYNILIMMNIKCINIHLMPF